MLLFGKSLYGSTSQWSCKRHSQSAIRQSYKFTNRIFFRRKKGNIIARMTNDVQEIEWGIMSSLEMIFRDPIKILIYLGTMFIISWQMTSFVFILLPIVGLIIGRTGRSLRKVSMTGQQQMGSLMAQIEEMIGGLRIIKAFNAEKHISDKFKDTNKDYTGLMNFVNRKDF